MAENIIKQTDHIDPRDQMALAGLVDLNPPKLATKEFQIKALVYSARHRSQSNRRHRQTRWFKRE
jgi:hypothetical protein